MATRGGEDWTLAPDAFFFFGLRFFFFLAAEKGQSGKGPRVEEERETSGCASLSGGFVFLFIFVRVSMLIFF